MSEKDLSRSSQNVGELGGSVLWLDGPATGVTDPDTALGVEYPAMGVEDPVSNAVKEVAVVVELLVEVDLM
jgi:hypothetical protein